jgi:hypothetical protein
MHAKQLLTTLETLLLALFVASLLIAMWGYNLARKEAERSAPLQFKEQRFIGWWTDQFIWSASAPRKVRRLYVVTSGCFILGFACLTALVWIHHGYPRAVLPSLIFVVVTTTFAWKCFRQYPDI